MNVRPVLVFALACTLTGASVSPAGARAQPTPNWLTAWAASMQGPYPTGYASAQPNLSFAFPDAAAGARDQSFRLVLRPDVWAPRTRVRFTNAFGTQPVTFDHVFVGEQALADGVVPGTNRAVRFSGADTLTVAPGHDAWSDPVDLPFVRDPGDAALAGRKLALSYHIAGQSGPMTWHAKGLTTSYLTAPGVGAAGERESDPAFTFATASWFFVDAVDMAVPAGSRLIVAFGDSITDGTASTMNGDDRWPDDLSRRLHAAYGSRVAIVNEGIGGNRITGPATYNAAKPFAGGPAMVQRLERDVLSLSGVSTVVLFEGINDFGRAGEGTTPEAATAAVGEIVTRIRTRLPNVHVVGATLTPALGSTNPDHGSADEDVKRRAYNDFIRTTKIFDGVIDFDAVTLDPQTGGMKRTFIPDNTVGGPGDKLHPNRAGYQAMANAIDLHLFAP